MTPELEIGDVDFDPDIHLVGVFHRGVLRTVPHTRTRHGLSKSPFPPRDHILIRSSSVYCRLTALAFSSRLPEQ